MKNKKILILICVVLLCVIVAFIKNMKEVNTEEKSETKIITIPASYFEFINSEAEDAAKGYADYCESSKLDNGNVVIEVTDTQREYLINTNREFIEGILNDFYAANDKYSCDMSESYNYITFIYDENIDSFLQGRVLAGITSMHVLNGILETENSDWNLKITVKNCHTGNVVAEGILPEEGLKFNVEEWKQSY